MIRVYVDMVADLFHYGHANFLRQAKQLGDHLIVGIHSDEVVKGYKRAPIMTMEERIETVASCRYVDEVLPDAPLVVDQEWINTHRINLVVHGDDFSEHMKQLCYKTPIDLGILRLVSYTSEISTTEIIQRIEKYMRNSGLHS
ncbi:adenylyltransferase/cytidyltransferase family protein [Chloroflexi bacterium]|nr:adenylyltransferase/cytidyltransferase family protein [Chloroflexota bacterium]